MAGPCIGCDAKPSPRFRLAAALLLALGLTACGGTAGGPVVGDALCSLRNQPRAGWRSLPPLQPARVAALTARGLPEPVVVLADTIGALTPLEALLDAEARPDGAVDFLLARQSLAETVLLATLDVQSTLALIECEGERADQLLVHVERIQARRERTLSIAAVAFGGATAVVTGGLSIAGLGRAADIAGIVGGSAEGIAAGALFFGSPTGRLRISQNLFEEVARQPEHALIFPPRVWRYLTRRPAPGEPNIIDELFADWRANGLVPADPTDQGMTALTSQDGVYDAEALERRDAIFDQLDARVALMNRDLRYLLEEVVARPPPRFRAGQRARVAGRLTR